MPDSDGYREAAAAGVRALFHSRGSAHLQTLRCRHGPAVTFEASLDFAQRADQADPLRALRSRFAMPHDVAGNELVYLAGHSLGLQPLDARARVNEELDDWAALGVRGHEEARRPWIPYHENLTAGLVHLTGARPSAVIAMNSLTVNIHLMLASFFRPSSKRTKLPIETGDSSPDRHAVTSHLAWHGLDPPPPLLELTPPPGSDSLP